MRRGATAAELPAGIRQDTRKHTRHPLRPVADDVRDYLAGDLTWDGFAQRYQAEVRARFARDRAPFDEIAGKAEGDDVYLGCSCPTRANPDVRRCHTWLALELMAQWYPSLSVEFPTVPGA